MSKNVYIHGGYDGTDIFLSGLPGGGFIPPSIIDGVKITELPPDTDFGFQVVVYNDEPTEAKVTARFWQFDGGIGTKGKLVGKVTDTIAAKPAAKLSGTNWAYFPSKFDTIKFHSAKAGEHRCAVVSISFSDPDAESCGPDSDLDTDVPDPGTNGSAHMCSGWRNTVGEKPIGGGGGGSSPFRINLAATQHQENEPVRIEVATRLVPIGWRDRVRVKRILDIVEEAGGVAKKPGFLLSALQTTLRKVDLHVKLEPRGKGVKIEQLGAMSFQLRADRGSGSKFAVVGRLPRTSKQGEVYIIYVTAHYVQTSASPERTVQFTQVYYV